MENELFEKAPVHKAYFNMALPLVFSMVISLVYNMVDTFFIARTGNTNLVAGVSLGAPMFTAMIALGDIFGLGGSSVIARLFGQRKDEDAKRISSFCFYGAIICGVIVTVLLLIFRAPMLHLLGADANTYKYASQHYISGAGFCIHHRMIYTEQPAQVRRIFESIHGRFRPWCSSEYYIRSYFYFGTGYGSRRSRDCNNHRVYCDGRLLCVDIFEKE